MLALKYRIEVADAVAFNAHFNRERLRALGIWRGMARMGVWVAIGVTAVVAFDLTSAFTNVYGVAARLTSHWPKYLVMYAGMALVFVIAYPLALRPIVTLVTVWQAKRLMRRLLKESPREAFLGDYVLEIGEDGLRQRSGGFESHVAWSSIGKVAETKEHLFLHMGSMNAFIIPKRDVADADLGVLKQLLKKYVPSTA